MKNIEKKIEKLNIAIQQDSDYLYSLDTEYEVVTDQYMNGDILEPVGRYQNRIKREMYRVSKRLYRNKVKLDKLLEKYKRC